MLNWLVWGVPWQVQLSAIIILAGLLIALAMMTFGVAPVFRVLRVIGLPLLAGITALGLLSRAQQKGYEARKAEEDQAARKAERTVDETRTDVQSLPGDQLNERVDKWSRH
jgi:hypothetical protein